MKFKVILAKLFLRFYLFFTYRVLGIITFIKTEVVEKDKTITGWVYLKQYQKDDLDFVPKLSKTEKKYFPNWIKKKSYFNKFQ